MGKLTLLFVLAAVFAGTLLTLNTQGALGDAARLQADGQADVLAREIAETGQNLALARMVGPGGFRDPGLSVEEYQGGQFLVAVEALSTELATITVTGSYGGAVHTVRSTHRYDPMDAPGPIWLDVPFATGNVVGSATVTGGPQNASIHFDRRKHDELALGSFLPLSGITSDLGSMARSVGSALSVPAADAWAALYEDLNVDDAEGLYQAAVTSMDDSDLRIAGARTVTNAVTWGGPDKVTFVDGDLTVASSGRIQGRGALVVGGALRVRSGGRLDWNGLVIVRSDEDVLPIELDGTVNVTGAIAVAHEAFPPGGHLDVSVYRDRNGMTPSRPWGDQSNGMWGPRYPFYQHTHRFDQTPTWAPRGTRVFFLENGGGGRHNTEAQFYDLLRQIGSTPVYLEFANAEHHGFSQYTVKLGSQSDTLKGALRTGFGSFTHPGGGLRSAEFPANDLRHLDLDVRSLRALRQSFDDRTCDSWPLCIGRDWDRHDALALRVMRASDHARLYEASIYWHMQAAEVAAHEAEEAAWRSRILAGEAFGTHLRMGSGVTVAYTRGPISALATKLGFDGDEVILVETASQHVAAVDTRTTGGGNTVTLCHAGQPLTIDRHAQAAHLALHISHGDVIGATTGAPTTGAPTTGAPTTGAPTTGAPSGDGDG